MADRGHRNVRLNEEAEEDMMLDDRSVGPAEDDSQAGENLDDNFEDDYVSNQHLDQYEEADMDDRSYSDMSIAARRRAEAEMDKRDAQRRGNRRLGPNRNIPRGVRDDLPDDLSQANEHELEERRRQFQRQEFPDDDVNDNAEGDADFLDLERARGKLPEWIRKPETRRWIRKSFRAFLFNFVDQGGHPIYKERLDILVAENRASLEVEFKHLNIAFPTLAYWVYESPQLIISELNRVTLNVIKGLYPGYEHIHHEVYVRIVEYPIEERIRELRTQHMNQMVRIRGVITRRHPVYSELKVLWYVCACGHRMGPEVVNEMSARVLRVCTACQRKGRFTIDQERTVYGNHQKIVIQESPSTVPPGRVPRNKEVLLLGDNIDCARPGDEVDITGVYTAHLDYGMNVKHGFPLFKTLIEANSVRRVKEIEMTQITSEDREAIERLSKMPNIFDILVHSIAPSIFGHVTIKTAMALALFGGTSVDSPNHRVRGDINVLLVGDPGLSKSQFLKYIQSISSRAIYTTGKGASAVGLTACVRKDPVSGEWMLEGGALVLADQGICLIDEFDKMNEVDRTSIHEAMEQQSISISKAGIVANLPARCSVIAAANPIRGIYDNQLSFQDNLNLSEPILSRFDVLCVLKDEVNFAHDKQLANFIINSHARSHPENSLQETPTDPTKAAKEQEDKEDFTLIYGESETPRMKQSLLKKYILFAKSNFRPKLTDACRHKLQNFYVKLRNQSQAISGITIVVRHLESMIRFAEASAKMHLRSEVIDKDVDIAIDVLLKSFLQSTKPSIARNLERKFAQELNAKRNIVSLINHLLNGLVKSQIEYLNVLQGGQREGVKRVRIQVALLQEKCREHGIDNLEPFFRSDTFKQNYQLENEAIVKEI